MEDKEGKKLKIIQSCPMPKMNLDIITLGHGSGGLLTNRLLDSGVFQILNNEILDSRHDGAIVEIEGKMAISTDSFVISPIIFPGGDIGELAVNGTVNDLAMCGAIPEYLTLSFILEEGLPIKTFWDILVSIRYACEKAGVMIVTGDTKVVERGKGDQVFINTTGIGKIHPKANIQMDRIKIGDKIIVSDRIATHGIAIMSVRKGLSFETTIESDTRNLNHIVCDLLDEFGEKIHLLRDPTRGGVATVLVEIAKQINMGIAIHQSDLPIAPDVASACEILGLDPLYVANEGIFIAIVDEAYAENIIAMLKGLDHCGNASIIGEVVSEHPDQVILNSAIGGKRAVNMLIGEQLPRIC